MKRLVLKFYKSVKIAPKMASLQMQKFEKRKCEVFYVQKYTLAATNMIRLTFAYILYSLYIVHKYKSHTKAVFNTLKFQCLFMDLRVLIGPYSKFY